MRVAILTAPGDYHSHAVAWGLRKRGATCDLCFLSDIPQRSTISFRPAANRDFRIGSPGGAMRLTDYERIWLRRPGSVVLPAGLHPTDAGVSQSDWRELVQGLIAVIDNAGIFSVNPAKTYAFGHLKAHHLDVARDSGLEIPTTLISNDKDEILRFIGDNAKASARTIIKGFRTHAWNSYGRERGVTFSTSFITAEDVLASDPQSNVHIFQAYVEKSFEARVTVMGKTLFGSRLQSQSHETSRADFRLVGDWSLLGCDRIDIPPTVRDAIFRFHRVLGFNFGSMDFIVDAGGHWIFLETNTVGNFLWVENISPETTLLDAFVGFLMSGDDDYVYDRGERTPLSLTDFESSVPAANVKQFLDDEICAHIRRPSRTLVE